jgi:glyoxylase I family protein
MGPDKFHWCLLRLGSAEIMLNTAYEFDNERPVPADRARIAAHGDTGLFFGCPDVDGAYEELRDKGVAVKPPKVAPYGMKQMPVQDPDGYGLCFQWKAED